MGVWKTAKHWQGSLARGMVRLLWQGYPDCRTHTVPTHGEGYYQDEPGLTVFCIQVGLENLCTVVKYAVCIS